MMKGSPKTLTGRMYLIIQNINKNKKKKIRKRKQIKSRSEFIVCLIDLREQVHQRFHLLIQQYYIKCQRGAYISHDSKHTLVLVLLSFLLFQFRLLQINADSIVAFAIFRNLLGISNKTSFKLMTLENDNAMRLNNSVLFQNELTCFQPLPLRPMDEEV